MPQVSVVMPVRDGERWIAQSINSIQQQTLSDFELIVVDDGSVDRSLAIAESLARTDARIRVLPLEKSGLVAALNCGFSNASGRLIARLDADDTAASDRLEKQAKYLDQHSDVGLLGTWAVKIGEDGQQLGHLRPETDPDCLAELLPRTNPFIHSSVMLRTAILERVDAYRATFLAAEDYDLWLRISEVTKVANLPECLVEYRCHPEGVSHRSRVRQLFSTRLAQRAAVARRMAGHDPSANLNAPPDWTDPHSRLSPFYGDLIELYQLLDLADRSNDRPCDIRHMNLSCLNGGKDSLTHAERKMAQLALFNVMRALDRPPPAQAAILLFHLVRLLPMRAISIGWKALGSSWFGSGI